MLVHKVEILPHYEFGSLFSFFINLYFTRRVLLRLRDSNHQRDNNLGKAAAGRLRHGCAVVDTVTLNQEGRGYDSTGLVPFYEAFGFSPQNCCFFLHVQRQHAAEANCKVFISHRCHNSCSMVGNFKQAGCCYLPNFSNLPSIL